MSDASTVPHSVVLIHDTLNVDENSAPAVYAKYASLSVDTEYSNQGFDYQLYTSEGKDDIFKFHRVFVNLKVAEKVTCPSFVGKATDAECCPDFVFDQYFDKKCEIPNYKILTIDETFEYSKQNRHLPTIKTNRSNIEEKQLNLNELILNLWETVEIQSLHIKELNDRIKNLEEKANK